MSAVTRKRAVVGKSTYKKMKKNIDGCRPRDVAGDNRWMSMHNRYMEECKNTAACDILLIGDSIVQQMQFTKFYEKHAPKEKIILNFGIGGDTVENVIWRIKDGDWLDKLKPRLIVLFVGTNNINSTPVEIADMIDVIVQTMQTKSPASHIVLPLLLPKGQFPNKLREKNKAVNNLLETKYTSQDNSITIVDMERNKIIDEDGTISHKILHDYLHLSEEGYTLTWSSVFEKCNEILNIT